MYKSQLGSENNATQERMEQQYEGTTIKNYILFFIPI